MKKRIRQRRCKNCSELYKPDPRHLKRQKFCRKPECKAASKKYSQQKWLNKPKNRDYFSGSEHVTRVRQWRQDNPDYWKRKKSTKKPSLIEDALQEIIDASDQETVKLIPDIFKELIKKKRCQHGQTIFFKGTV